MNNGVHLLDLITFLFDACPVGVHIVGQMNGDNKDDPSISGLLEVDGVSIHLVGQPSGQVSRFELELAFADAVVRLEDSKLTIRKFERSEIFTEAMVPDRGVSQPTQIGKAMLTALDELTSWMPGGDLSSDIFSASQSIALAAELRQKVLGDIR
jgi:hypothetical protein